MKPYVYIHTFHDMPNFVWVEKKSTVKKIGRTAARLYAACALMEPCEYGVARKIYRLTCEEYEAIIGGDDG